MNKFGFLRFCCNICGAECEASMYRISREEPSCRGCGSTVRMRAIVHALSRELFGESLALPDFPERKHIKGIGMSDWDEYAQRLAKSLDYTNTFYHKAPRLDITELSGSQYTGLDFIISSDVYEHIEPPVSRAFINARAILKSGGFMVFSVPFKLQGDTDEHFPELYDYQIKEEKGRPVLYNTTKEGKAQKFNDLLFHGGPGSTLEMRVFSRAAILKEYTNAGFEEILFCDDSYFEYGIYWINPSGVPIIARTKRRTAPPAGASPSIVIEIWGPDRTSVGQPFNLQPNGASALWAKGRGFQDMRRLTFGDWDLKTTVTNSGTMLSAEIPPHLLAEPRSVILQILTARAEWMQLGEFRILPEG